MFNKILISFMMVLLLIGTCYGKPYVEYTLNTSPAITDTALGVTDPDLIPTGWTFRNYLFSDIFALYLTQDWIPTGSVDLSTATGAVLMGRQSNQIFFDGTFTMTTVVFSWTGNHTHEYGNYDSQTVAASEVDASGIVSGVKSVTAGTGMTNSGTATNPILDVTASGASITEVATEPAAVDMDPGTLYVNQNDGGLSYLLDDSSFVNRYAATSSTGLFLLTLTDPGNNDYIQSTDGFLDCGNGATDCTYLYTSGTTPELTATADAGRQFDNWTGDATQTSTTTNPDTILMDASKGVGGAFSSGAITISYVAVATGTAATNTDVTAVMPVGTTDGMIMTASMQSSIGSVTFTPPAGWTEVENIANGTDTIEYNFYKIASSETGPYTFVASASASGLSLHIATFSKTSGTWVAPTGVNLSNTSTSVSDTCVTNSVTIPESAMLVCSFGNDGVYAPSTPPVGMTEISLVSAANVSLATYYESGLSGATTKTMVWPSSDQTTSIAVVLGAE